MRPEEAGPWTSDSAPRGKPPPRSASTSATPVTSGRQPRVLPPQRGRVGLEAAGPEQVLERTLALVRRGGGGGERDGGAHWELSLFLRLQYRRGTLAVNPEDLVVRANDDP